MPETISTRCCIAGGGPAGMMLGFLLARAGVAVTVIEKHADVLRDFRGDTIHPSTLELMSELGLLDEFLKLPHQKATTVGAKAWAARFAETRSGYGMLAMRGIEVGAAVVIIAFGSLLLAGFMASERLVGM